MIVGLGMGGGVVMEVLEGLGVVVGELEGDGFDDMDGVGVVFLVGVGVLLWGRRKKSSVVMIVIIVMMRLMIV